ncbi:acetate uptake transporter family protein [Desulforhopalus singaporensis]|uniref:GPR1/FUN34/yaaH family protein n=1 Tax=Desulforhopalus singaporensis TaxID=91360 RepID=A0A1H0U1W0_9BACT|nr:hypothetical protein [Desulforhopalus singaporensis]SDP60164.1 hypothetical protein SAMN05660330_03340 [Desulforhopalus singaporensis]
MDDNINVNVKVADAGPAGWMAYSMATLIAWPSLCGMVNDRALLFMAAISLACTIPYLTAGISQLRLSNVAGGVTWIYFGAFFAFCSAECYLISYFAPIYQWQLDPRILGFEWAVLAMVLILTTPVFIKYSPAAASLSVLAADIGLATLALIYWGYTEFIPVSGWSFFVAGVFGIIMTVGGIFDGAGMKFPMGRPLGSYLQRRLSVEEVAS